MVVAAAGWASVGDAVAADQQNHPDIRCMALGLSLPATESRFKKAMETDLATGIDIEAIKRSYAAHKDRAIERIPDADIEHALDLVDVLARAEARRAGEAYEGVLSKSHYIEREYARCLVLDHLRSRARRFACFEIAPASCDLAGLAAEHARQMPFYALLASSDPQAMFAAAGEYMRNGEATRSVEVYRKIIERHASSAFASRAKDELAAWQRRSAGEGSASGADRGRSEEPGHIVVFVTAECVTGRYCPVTHFAINGPANAERWGSGDSLKLSARGVGRVPPGRYDYSFSIDGKCLATGSFVYNGTSQNITIRHYPGCAFSDVRQH